MGVEGELEGGGEDGDRGKRERSSFFSCCKRLRPEQKRQSHVSTPLLTSSKQLSANKTKRGGKSEQKKRGKYIDEMHLLREKEKEGEGAKKTGMRK